MTAPKISEKDWQKTVIDYARARGWRVAHFRTSRTQSGGWSTAVQADGEGYPDLTMVRGPRLLFVELKAEKGRVAEKQAEWLTDLAVAAPGCVTIWKPSDWAVVERTLR
jgi:hypothetical protein